MNFDNDSHQSGAPDSKYYNESIPKTEQMFLESAKVTLVFFIENLIQETLLINNPQFIANSRILLVYPETYQPALSFVFPKITVKYRSFSKSIAEIINFIDTEWFLYLKPEENLSSDVSTLKELKFPVYQLKINTLMSSGNNETCYEPRIFHKDFLLQDEKSEYFLPVSVKNYAKGFPALETAKFNKFVDLFLQGNRELETIIYLFKKGYPGLDISRLMVILDKLKSNNILNKSVLELYIEIAEALIIKNDLLNAKSLLSESQQLDFSANVNFLLGEIHFNLGENQEALIFFRNCIKLIETETYYKYVTIDTTKLLTMSNFYLGKIFLELEDYNKAMDFFLVSLKLTPDSEDFIKAYEFAGHKWQKTKNYFNELDFSCQCCGNSCRTFDVNITNNDIKKIIDNRPDLKADDFVIFFENDTAKRLEPFIDTDGIKKELLLKKKEGINKECIFLENNLCSINDFKPMACKAFPFTYVSFNNTFKWSKIHKKFIKNSCAYKLTKNANIPIKMKEFFQEFYDDLAEFNNLSVKWNYNIEHSHKTEYSYSSENFLDYLLNINKNKEEFSKNIIESLSNDERIILLIENPFAALHFNNKNDLNLAIFLNGKNLETFLKIENVRDLEHKFKAKLMNFLEINLFHQLTFYSGFSFFNLFIYSQESLNRPIVNESKIIVNRSLSEMHNLPYNDLLKFELSDLRKRFYIALAMAKESIKAGDYHASKNLLNGMVINFLYYSIYLIEARRLSFFEISLSRFGTDDFKNFILRLPFFALNTSGQTTFLVELEKKFNFIWEFAEKIISK